jgi:hypothetical protein
VERLSKCHCLTCSKLGDTEVIQEKRICLLSPGHVSSNPRLVKEADALSEAGFRVTAIVGDYFPKLRAFDDALLSGKKWKVVKVTTTNRWQRVCSRLQMHAARPLKTLRPQSRYWTGLASAPQVRGMIKAAQQLKKADLYIGHCLAALPAAVILAQRTGAVAGFDVEDFHPGETGNEVLDGAANQVMAMFLPACRHLTAAAPLIAQECKKRYPILVEVGTVLNTFAPLPAKQAPSGPALGVPLRLYWFSQTVGPGRGLEGFIRWLGPINVPVTLSLRGMVSASQKQELEHLWNTTGCNTHSKICFLPTAPADQMVALAAEHDVGLNLEENTPLNRDLCLTNKIFTYLGAGIPQILSPTRGNLKFEAEAPGAAFVIRDSNSSGQILRLLADPLHWSKAREAVLLKNSESFRHESQMNKLINLVRKALATA